MKSQEDKILDYMAVHGSITPKHAYHNIGCLRLSARIYDLRERGYEIDSKRERDKKSGAVYCRYSLTEGDIKKYNAEQILLAQAEKRFLQKA